MVVRIHFERITLCNRHFCELLRLCQNICVRLNQTKNTVAAECFTAADDAPREELADRLVHYGDHFWLMFDGGTLIAFVDGMVTDRTDLTDDLYADAALHDAHGAWQMIFGVNTLPDYRRHGYAGQLIERAIADARAQGRRGLVLTCKDRLVHYYAKFGFVSEGVSSSTHGGVVW